jgi:hypothetical protein
MLDMGRRFALPCSAPLALAVSAKNQARCSASFRQASTMPALANRKKAGARSKSKVI